MLDGLRSVANGVVGKIIIVALVVGLGAFGLPTLFGGSGNTVAQIGTVDITADQYRIRYNLQAQGLTQVQQEQQQVPQAVLQGLVLEAVMNDAANRLGIGVSRAALGTQIGNDASFRSANGTFNELAFTNFINTYYGGVEERYLTERRGQEAGVQIVRALVPDNVPAAETYAELFNEFSNETRSVDYLRLTEADLGELPAPTEEQITTYFNDNVAMWNAPEQRVVQILALTPQALAQPDTITDEQVAAAYAERQADFGVAETRHIFQQVLTAAQATAVQAQLDAGQTYAQLVEAGTITPSDVGTVPATFFATNPAVAEAAFALELGGTTIVAGRLGQTLVHVNEIVAGTTPPLAEVQDELRQTLAEEAAAELIASLREQIEDARGGGATLAEIGEQFALPITTLTLDAQGNDALGNPIADLPGGQALVNGAFASEIGFADRPVNVSGGAVWYDLAEVVEPHPRPIEEVRDRVVEAWRANDVRNRLSTLAGTVQARIDAGEDFAAVAASLNVSLEHRDGIRRDTAADDVFSENAMLSIFNGPAGYTGTVSTPDGLDIVVFDVVGVEVPALDEATGDLVATIGREWAADLALAYRADLYYTETADVVPNYALIRDLTGITVATPAP